MSRQRRRDQPSEPTQTEEEHVVYVTKLDDVRDLDKRAEAARRRRGGYRLGLLLAGTAILIVGVVIGSLMAGDETATTTVSVPVAWTTSTATRPRPTAAQAVMQATATPRGQLTRTPTPSASCETVAVAQYEMDVRSYLNYLGKAMTEVGTLLGEAADNPILLMDPDWVALITAALWTVELYVDQIEDLSRPALLPDAHVHLLAAADHYRQFVELVFDSLDGEDTFLQATAAANRGTEALNEANAIWFRICGESSVYP